MPGCPTALADTQNTKVKLEKKPYPIHDEGFKKLFPTLLSKEMPFLELNVAAGGEGVLLKSDRPLRVRI